MNPASTTPSAMEAVPGTGVPEGTTERTNQTVPDQDPSRPRPHRQGLVSDRGTIVRVVSHLVIWTVIWVPTAAELSKGWRPLYDDATISQRAFQVFSLHSPLVGPYSQASSGGSHVVFGLGPLLFWLLAVPVHIDPAQGALWGVALLCAVALSTAAEAAWSRVGWIGCAVVAAVVVDLAWTEPSVFGHLLWNPSVGLIFFVATVVLASVVATGSLGWWPVVVLTASVAAQCHLIFAITAVALALLAPVVGLVGHGRTDRSRWLWAGIVVGVVCWIAPLIQQLTSHPGNLTVLAHTDRSQPGLGIDWGFRILATVGSPHPIWLTRSPTEFLATLKLVHPHSPLEGIVVVCVMVAITVIAWVSGRRNLASVGAVVVICSVGTVAAFTAFPTSDVLLLTYLHVMWWVPGILLWIVAVWAVVELLSALALLVLERRDRWEPLRGARRQPRVTRRQPPETRRQPRVTGWWRGAAALMVVAALLVAGVSGARALVVPASALGVDWNGVAQVNRIAPVIESQVPRGPVVLEFPRIGGNRIGVVYGVVWRLTADGWHTGVPGFVGMASGSVIPAGSRWPVVVVTLGGESAKATVVRAR